jgi:multidrug efflux pump subunit AcrA (membrane-fusion protein)
MARASATPPPGPPSKRWLKRLLPLLVLALAIAAFVHLRASREALPRVQAPERVVLVRTVPVQLASRSPQLLLYGRVSSYGMASLTAAVEADVVEVAAREGAAVPAGAPLVNLDDADLKLQLVEREAELTDARAQLTSEHIRHEANLEALAVERRLQQLARQEVDRIDDLVGRSLGSATQRDQARAELEGRALALVSRQHAVSDHPARRAMLESRVARARAARDRAELDLQRTSIRAPFAGRVASLPVAVGDRVSRGTLLAELVDTGHLEVRAQIPNSYLAQVRAAIGREQTLTAHGYVDGVPMVLELAHLAATTEPASGGVEANFDVIDGAEALTVGRVLALILDLPAVAGVVELPYEALYGLDRVYRVENERMRAVPVSLIGERHAGGGARQVLLRGTELREGDAVIVTQLPNAVSGLRVRVGDAEPS